MKIRRPITPGYVYSSEDYESGELVTDAQSCRWICGFSALGDALIAGLKVHNLLGATMLGLSYEEFQKRFKAGDKQCIDARQAGKPGNFGLPGLMGPVRLVLQQRVQGPNTPCPGGPSEIEDENGNLVPGYKGLRFCILMDGAKACGVQKTTMHREQVIPPTCVHCIECATTLKNTWLKQWPEHRIYFEFVSNCIDRGMTITWQALERWPWLKEWYTPNQQLAPGEIMQHVTGRIRGGLEASACANGFFQALLADAAKAAHRRVTRECYDATIRVPALLHENSKPSRYAGGPSPLFGSRPIVFQHDEILMEHIESLAHDGAMRVSEIMVDELRWFCPDLAPACAVEPTLMRKWIKGAKPKWQRGGKERADEYDRLIPWDDAA